MVLARSFCLTYFCPLLEKQEGREQKSSARTMEKWHPKSTFLPPHTPPHFLPDHEKPGFISP